MSSVGWAVLSAAQDAFVAMRPDGRIVAWNAAAARTFGWTAEEAVGRTVEELLVPAAHRPAHRAGLLRYERTGRPRVIGSTVEMPALHRDGRRLTVELTIDEVDREDERLYFAFLRDVGERKAEQERVAWMADAVAATRDVVVTVDLDGIVTSANPAFERMFGASPSGVVGRPVDLERVRVVGRDEPPAIEQLGKRRWDGIEVRFDHPDGRRRELLLEAAPILDPAGAPRGSTLVLRDVTEERAARRRMSDQLERLQSLAEPTATSEHRPERTADDEVAELMRTAREQLGLDVAWLSSIADDRLRFDAIDGDAEVLGGVRPGDDMPLEAAYCSLMLDERIPHVVADTRADPLTAELPPTLAGVTAYGGVPVVLADGTLHGTFCVAGTGDHADLDPSDARFLRVLARLAADAVDRGRRAERERRSRDALTAVHALLAALDARDHYTGDHSRSVVDLAIAVAEELGLEADAVREVEQVALLHDVGKVGIPDDVLQKPGPLDDAEWALMRQHPAIGERIVAGIAPLAHLAHAVRAEHERWDGGGYPDGLVGAAIPLCSRIGLACDAWHAMRSDRPYRRALPRAVALDELERGAGGQFDPDVVEALLRVLERHGD